MILNNGQCDQDFLSDFLLPILTAMSVAAENASGTVDDTKRAGVTAIVIAVRLLFLPHHFFSPNSLFPCYIHAQHPSFSRLRC